MCLHFARCSSYVVLSCRKLYSPYFFWCVFFWKAIGDQKICLYKFKFTIWKKQVLWFKILFLTQNKCMESRGGHNCVGCVKVSIPWRFWPQWLSIMFRVSITHQTTDFWSCYMLPTVPPQPCIVVHCFCLNSPPPCLHTLPRSTERNPDVNVKHNLYERRVCQVCVRLIDSMNH